MGIIVREVVEDDAPAIVALLNPIISAGIYTALDETISEADQKEFIRSFPERGVYHAAVCEDSQEVVGIQDVLPAASGSSAGRHVGEVSTFVSLSRLGSGIGSRLCETTCQVARTLGFRKLLAVIRADNPKAVSFYLSQGFRIIGTAEKHVCIKGRYIDEIFTEKLLTDKHLTED